METLFAVPRSSQRRGQRDDRAALYVVGTTQHESTEHYSYQSSFPSDTALNRAKRGSWFHLGFKRVFTRFDQSLSAKLSMCFGTNQGHRLTKHPHEQGAAQPQCTLDQRSPVHIRESLASGAARALDTAFPLDSSEYTRQHH